MWLREAEFSFFAWVLIFSSADVKKSLHFIRGHTKCNEVRTYFLQVSSHLFFISAKYRSTLKQGAKPDNGWFSKFPKDIVKCEELTGGDPKLLEKEPYIERVEQKIDYKDIFGPADDSAKKKGKKGR